MTAVRVDFKVLPLQCEYIAKSQPSEARKERSNFEYRLTARRVVQRLYFFDGQELTAGVLRFYLVKVFIDIFQKVFVSMGKRQQASKG
jgi:hypothetical protein